VLWVCSLTLAGYLFGNVPWVQANLSHHHLGHDRRARPAGALWGVEGAARSRCSDMKKAHRSGPV
jgi:hypothetical protein